MTLNFFENEVSGMMTLDSFIAEFKKDWRKIPNKITLSRLALGVFSAMFISIGWYNYALVIFAALALTDWVDGYVARRIGQTTNVGKIIDPIADRIFMGVTLISLISKVPIWISFILFWFIFSAIIIGIIIFRAYRNGVCVKPNFVGKVKTALLSLLVGCLILYHIDGFANVYGIIPFLITVTLLSSIISFLGYIFEYTFLENN